MGLGKAVGSWNDGTWNLAEFWNRWSRLAEVLDWRFFFKFTAQSTRSFNFISWLNLDEAGFMELARAYYDPPTSSPIPTSTPTSSLDTTLPTHSKQLVIHHLIDS